MIAKWPDPLGRFAFTFVAHGFSLSSVFERKERITFVGGFCHPSEKYAQVKKDHLPQFLGWRKKMFETTTWWHWKTGTLVTSQVDWNYMSMCNIGVGKATHLMNYDSNGNIFPKNSEQDDTKVSMSYVCTHIHQRFQRKSLKTAKELPIFGGYRHFSPSQIPKKKITPKTLRFLSSIRKKQNFTASPQTKIHRFYDQTWVTSNRRGGEGSESPEAFLPWHHGCVACRRSCNAQPSYDLKLWNAGERSSPIPKISTRCFPAVLF